MNTFIHYYKYIKFNYVDCFFEKGQIEDEGTFTALQEKRVTFLKILQNDEEANEKKPEESLKIDTNSTLDIKIKNDNINEDTEEVEPQETEEFLVKGNLSKSLYWKYLRSGGSILMIASFLFCIVLAQIGNNGCDYWVGYW